MTGKTRTLLCIDPGLTHLAVGIFRGTSEEDLVHVWSYMYECKKDPELLAHCIQCMAKKAKEEGTDRALLEYQAPMGNAVAARWNIYVEGGLATGLWLQGIPVETISPSAAKRSLHVATGDYAANKRLALKYAKEKCPTIDIHHVADCYILARYYMKMNS